MKHYILIEVREPERTDSRRAAASAGNIRREIIRYCEAQGINAAHCIVREDRPFIYGTGEPTPYSAAKALFSRAMGAEWRRRKAEQVAEDAPWDAR